MLSRPVKPTHLLAAALWMGLMGLVAVQAFDAPAALGASVTEISGNVALDRFATKRPAGPDMAIRRGEVVRTGEGSRALLALEDGMRIALDERTDLEIVSLAPNDLAFRLVRGRLVATRTDDTGNIVFETNATQSGFRKGALSIVNYDFKETVSVIPLDTTVVGIVVGDGGTITTTAVDIHETDPVTITDISFDSSTSSAKDFYEWALSR